MPRFASLHPAAVVVGYLLAYVFLDWVSFIYPVGPFAITPWNPPAGLSLALLLGFGLRYAPALFAGALLAELAVRGMPAPLGYEILAALVHAAGYGAGAAVLQRSLRVRPRFDSLHDLSILLVVVAVTTLIVAVAYVAVYGVAGLVPRQELAVAVLQYWIGDLIGIVVFTPLLLMLGERRAAGVLRIRGEMLVQAASLLAVMWLVFGLEARDELSYFYLLFLPLIWIATRFGVYAATLAIFAIQCGLIVAIQAAGMQISTVLELQFLTLALAVTGLILGASMSARRNAEAQLARRQMDLNRSLRLAAAGEMASALAHELHQPLAAIVNYVNACKLMIAGTQDRQLLADTMDHVVDEAGRASEVVRRLRDFFRSGASQLERIEPALLIRDALQSLAGQFASHGITLRIECAADLPAVLVDEVQVSTVICNLAANAIDAISAADCKERVVEVTAVRGDPGSVEVTVRDSGPGVGAEISGRLFEPFATDKPSGMGLGLALSRSMIEAHGGRLWVNKQTRQGAQFHFTLPAATQTGAEHEHK